MYDFFKFSTHISTKYYHAYYVHPFCLLYYYNFTLNAVCRSFIVRFTSFFIFLLLCGIPMYASSNTATYLEDLTKKWIGQWRSNRRRGDRSLYKTSKFIKIIIFLIIKRWQWCMIKNQPHPPPTLHDEIIWPPLKSGVITII